MTVAIMDEVDEKLTPEIIHKPVMLKEVVSYLKPPPGGSFVDCTIGLGGHASAMMEFLGPRGSLIGVDRDIQALEKAKKRLSAYSGRCVFVHDNFYNIKTVLDTMGISGVDRIFLDLGLSSFQIGNPDRGFSLRSDGPLDMRMDQTGQITAYDLINSLSENELDTILKDFGQERWHHQIARRLVRERSNRPIESTKELRHIVMRSIPYRVNRYRIHPATRTFQAIRIAVNRELDAVEKAMDECMPLLNPGGRIGVLAFHSLEDKIVKERFKAALKEGVASLPFKKPLRPEFEETRSNPRSRSARFRVAEKII